MPKLRVSGREYCRGGFSSILIIYFRVVNKIAIFGEYTWVGFIAMVREYGSAGYLLDPVLDQLIASEPVQE